MIGHLDATLGLFDPDGNPKGIKAKRPYKRVKLFGAGKPNRLILDALRRADGPLSTQAVIDAVLAEVGFGPDAAKGMRSRARSNMPCLSKVRGMVIKDRGKGNGDVAAQGVIIRLRPPPFSFPTIRQSLRLAFL